jgi:hypothetical protein
MTHVKQTRKSSMIYNLHASQNIVRLIKPRRMGWAGHIAHKGEMRNAHKFWLENLEERDHLEDPGIDGKIMLK